MSLSVFLNAGHSPNGNPDPGCCNNKLGLRECDIVKEITDLVAYYLSTAGVKVVGNVQSDSLIQVVNEANSSGADLFISIHCNSFNTIANGTEICVYPNSRVGNIVGQCVLNQIVSSLNTASRGIKVRVPGVNGLYVLTNTDMPAILVETAFLDNQLDAVKLRDRKDDFARAIARGVTDYLHLHI